ncbi:MAG: DUF669 domain-containing protein [Dokdonella sp.]
MSFLGNLVDNSAEPAKDFAPIPSGEYIAVITDSDMKATRNNDGQYLALTYQVADGPLKGRLVWCNLNLENKNQQTVQIAQQQLASIRAATGVSQLTDSAQLHNIPHVIRVEFVAAGKNRDRDSNVIKAWKRIEGATAQAPVAPYQAPAAAAPAANAAPAWAQKPAV